MPERQLTDHLVGGLNEKLEIHVRDEPGPGGANHRYDIVGFDTEGNPSRVDKEGYRSSFSRLIVLFQHGPLGEAGSNGISNEALLAILIDRMRGFQSGPFSCRENAIALTKLEEALHWLQDRTRKRIARGVEGTSKK